MPKTTALTLGVSSSSTQCPIFQYCSLLLPFFSLLLGTSPSARHLLITLGPGPVDNVWERKGTNIDRVSTNVPQSHVSTFNRSSHGSFVIGQEGETIMVSILQRGKWRHREAKWLAQDRTASERHRQNSDLGLYYRNANVHSIIPQAAFTQRMVPAEITTYHTWTDRPHSEQLFQKTRCLWVNTGCHLNPPPQRERIRWGRKLTGVVGNTALLLGHNQLV